MVAPLNLSHQIYADMGLNPTQKELAALFLKLKREEWISERKNEIYAAMHLNANQKEMFGRFLDLERENCFRLEMEKKTRTQEEMQKIREEEEMQRIREQEEMKLIREQEELHLGHLQMQLIFYQAMNRHSSPQIPPNSDHSVPHDSTQPTFNETDRTTTVQVISLEDTCQRANAGSISAVQQVYEPVLLDDAYQPASVGSMSTVQQENNAILLEDTCQPASVGPMSDTSLHP